MENLSHYDVDTMYGKLRITNIGAQTMDALMTESQLDKNRILFEADDEPISSNEIKEFEVDGLVHRVPIGFEKPKEGVRSRAENIGALRFKQNSRQRREMGVQKLRFGFTQVSPTKIILKRFTVTLIKNGTNKTYTSEINESEDDNFQQITAGDVTIRWDNSPEKTHEERIKELRGINDNDRKLNENSRNIEVDTKAKTGFFKGLVKKVLKG